MMGILADQEAIVEVETERKKRKRNLLEVEVGIEVWVETEIEIGENTSPGAEVKAERNPRRLTKIEEIEVEVVPTVEKVEIKRRVRRNTIEIPEAAPDLHLVIGEGNILPQAQEVHLLLTTGKLWMRIF